MCRCAVWPTFSDHNFVFHLRWPVQMTLALVMVVRINWQEMARLVSIAVRPLHVFLCTKAFSPAYHTYTCSLTGRCPSKKIFRWLRPKSPSQSGMKMSCAVFLGDSVNSRQFHFFESRLFRRSPEIMTLENPPKWLHKVKTGHISMHAWVALFWAGSWYWFYFISSVTFWTQNSEKSEGCADDFVLSYL